MNAYAIPGLDRNATAYDMITHIVSRHTGTAINEITRKQRVVKPRQIAMYLIKKHTKMSTYQISRKMQMNHATVLHGCKTVQNMLDTRDSVYYETIQQLDRLVRLQQFRRHLQFNTFNI